mgnify:CR=1 FL=1
MIRTRKTIGIAVVSVMAVSVTALWPGAGAAWAVSDGQLGLPAYPKAYYHGGHGAHASSAADPRQTLHAGSEDGASADLAAVLHRARPGAVIVVYPGAYTAGPLIVKKPVSLVAAPGTSATLRPDGTRACVEIDVEPGTRVEIVGLAFAPPAHGSRTAPCIESRGADLRLVDVRIEASGLLPAVIIHGGEAWIESSDISGGETGLVLGGEPFGSHILIGSRISGNTGDGLRVGPGARVIAADNVFAGNGRAGISDTGGSGLYSHNDIAGNGTGVLLHGADGDGPGPLFSANDISGNRGAGVEARPGAQGVVAGNCIHGNGGAGIADYSGRVAQRPPNYFLGNGDMTDLGRREARAVEEAFGAACR